MAIALVFILVLPIGFDLPKSIYSILSGQSAAVYGDKQRVNRGLPPWSLVREVGDVVAASTKADTPVLCAADSDCPDYYFICGRVPVTRYVQPLHLVFDKHRMDEAISSIRSVSFPIVLISCSNLSYSSMILEQVKVADNRSEQILNRVYNDSKSVAVYKIPQLSDER